VALGTLFSCANESRRQEPPPPAPEAAAAAAAPAAPQTESEAAAATPDTREEIVERGTDSFIGTSRARAAGGPGGDINLQFDNSDIKEFAQVVLGDMLGVNYVIDPMVMGNVTIHTATPITREQLLPLFEEILASNGAALARTNDLYRVVPLAGAARNAPVATPGRGEASGFRTQVIP
jgi:general secretion pathway protein D